MSDLKEIKSLLDEFYCERTLDKVIEEANASWDKMHEGSGNDNRYKSSYITGWIKQSYESLHNHIFKKP